jgi:hypothetical protein
VFGKRFPSDPNRTWGWDGSEWTLLNEGTPPTVDFHTLAYDMARSRGVLLTRRNGTVWETWELDGSTWILRDTGGVNPLPFSSTSLAYDAARRVTVLHSSVGGKLSGTWEWDGTEWAMRNSGTPANFDFARSLVYDDARARVVMVASGYIDSTTWAWDGSAWTQLAAGSFTERYAYGAVYDTARRSIVVFGGEAPCEQPLCPVLSDLWELSTVNADCPADWDCSGALNSGDFFEFLDSFFAGGDYNGDGMSDSRDFFEYVAAFFSGCA